jgi:phage terminase large subunit GpA-like protein
VFLHVEESSNDEELRREQTYCTECNEYAWLRLVERVRTVTVYWALKSSERHYFLICDHCHAEFRVKERKRTVVEQADITSLLRKAGGRHVPFSTRAISWLAVLAIPTLWLGLLLAWWAWRDCKKVGGSTEIFARRVFYVSLAVNVAFLIAVLIQGLIHPDEY